MKKLLKFILDEIVEYKDDVNIEEEREEGNVVYHLELNEEDKGRVIGKGGKNVKAIRQILSIPAREKDLRVYIKID